MNSSDSKAREAFEAWAMKTCPEILIEFGTGPTIQYAKAFAAWNAALQWAASQQAAEGDDEVLRLRAKVDALTREAWTWSKACESESMRIHGVKDAINKAYGIVSKEHPWTPEHSKNYPQQAANIINAAMTIFAPPATQGGADEQR